MAAVAARTPGVTPVLIDLDAIGGGLDIALGAEAVPGARWSGLHATGGRLDPAQLLEGLPRWQSVPFLACDGHLAPSPQAVRSVLRAAREIGPIVVDLGRASTPARAAALEWISALVIVVPSEIRAVTAAAASLASAVDDGFAGVTRVVVREDSAVLGARRIAGVLDLGLAGSMPTDPGLRAGRDRGIDPRRFRRGTRRLADEVLAWAGSVPDRSAAEGETEPTTDAVAQPVDQVGPLRVTALRPGAVLPDAARLEAVRPHALRTDAAGYGVVPREPRAGGHRLADAVDGVRARTRTEVPA